MESVVIYVNSSTLAEGNSLATLLREKGADVSVARVDAGQEAQAEVDLLAGDISVENRYPLVRIGVPKVRALFQRPEFNDVMAVLADGISVSYPHTSRSINIYTTPWCPDCRRIKRFLDDKGIVRQEINIDEDSKAAEWVLRRSGGRRVVPSFLVDERLALFNPNEETLGRLLGVS